MLHVVASWQWNYRWLPRNLRNGSCVWSLRLGSRPPPTKAGFARISSSASYSAKYLAFGYHFTERRVAKHSAQKEWPLWPLGILNLDDYLPPSKTTEVSRSSTTPS